MRINEIEIENSYLHFESFVVVIVLFLLGNLQAFADDTEVMYSGRCLNVTSRSTLFTGPASTVNPFDKTQVLEDIYLSVFQPTQAVHWPGNVKKYKLRDHVIVGQNGQALDLTTGLFKDEAQSYWSTIADGNAASLGGAANLIPNAGARTVYTFIGINPSSPVDLQECGNDCRLADGNLNITQKVLGIDGTQDPNRTTLLNWANGEDTQDVNKDNNATDARHQMGDAIHSQPAIVIYGQEGANAAEKIQDGVAFVATNDGYLHAISTDTGVELWSFVPETFLSDLKNIYNNLPATTKHYALDGGIRVLKYDVDGDGVINGNDRIIVYFSDGRGGDHYYALDVTKKIAPKFLWVLGSKTLPAISRSWSTPTLGRIKVGNGFNQNSQYFVLVFGGGYDVSEDGVSYVTKDSVGNAIYMVDAISGNLLWSVGGIGSGATLELPRMDHAIPSDVTLIDTNNDGYTDRMYVGDMAGQLWRFDFNNYMSAANAFSATGGVIASLGGHDSKMHPNSDNRRFYSTPDISSFNVRGGGGFFNIAIGSGYRGHPNNIETVDRFYSIRDYYPRTALTQAQYDGISPVKDSDLTDISMQIYDRAGHVMPVPISTKGWKLPLNSPVAQGEKVLARSTTNDGAILFTTFTPTNIRSTECSVSTGSARTYAVEVENGINRFARTPFQSFITNGVPPEVQLFPRNLTITGDGINGTNLTTRITTIGNEKNSVGQCLSGVTLLENCVSFGNRVRAAWKEAGQE